MSRFSRFGTEPRRRTDDDDHDDHDDGDDHECYPVRGLGVCGNCNCFVAIDLPTGHLARLEIAELQPSPP